jgi:hypothetical protein
MSHGRMSASSVAHKSTGGTLQSLPEPVDPVGNAPDYLTFKTVAPLRLRVSVLRYFPEMAASGRQLSIYKRGFAEALGATNNGLTFASNGAALVDS